MTGAFCHHNDKSDLKRNLGTGGANADYNKHDDKDNWRQPQRKEEGRGWAKMDAVTKRNPYRDS